MRTIFVNPTRGKKRKTRKRKNARKSSTTKLARLEKKVNAMARTKTRRRRRAAPPKRRRRRRRNAGVTSFVSNPLILSNPKRRRRRRRNPGMKFDLKTMANKLLAYGGGSAIGAAANIMALNKIENMWARNGARVASSVLAGMLLKGEFGAATAGALMYPVWQEVALRVLAPAAAAGGEATEADLDLLAADLEHVMSDMGNNEMYDW